MRTTYLPLIALLAAALLAAPLAAQSADLSLQKSASPDPVTPGGVLTYTLTLSNEGPNDAATVVLSDPLPAGVNFLALSSPGGWSCTTPAVGANGTVSCSTPTLTPGSAVFTLDTTVGAGVAQGTVLTNTATATSTTADPNPNNGTATATSNVSGATVLLSIAKSGSPDPVSAGSNLSYTITATNGNAFDLDTATVSDTLPSGTTFVSLAAPGGWACTTPAVGAAGNVSCSSIPMPPGPATFTLVVHVAPSKPAGPLPNQASFFSSTGGRDTTLIGSTSTQVQVSTDLSVTNSDAPDPVTAGGNVVYTITVTNAGPSDASSVTLSDTLPSGTTFVSLASPGGWTCSAPVPGAAGTVSCSGALIATNNAVFTLTVKTDPALPAGTLTDTATATAATDPNPANNSGIATTTVNLNPTTTTTITAPAVNYNANGVVTVRVSAPGAAPTGNVTLSVDGGAPISQPLAPVAGSSPPASSATFTLPGLSAGNHSLAASYAAQGPFAASSATGTLVVNPATTTTTLTVAPPATSSGLNVTFTANVTSSAGTPTGTVQFQADGTPFGPPVTLSSGTAILTTAANFSPGPHAITAVYSGNATFQTSTSAPSTLTIFAFVPTLGTMELLLLAAALAALAMKRIGQS